MSELPAGWESERLDVVSSLNPSKVALDLPEAASVAFVGMASVSEEFSAIDVSVRRPLAEVRKGYTQFIASDGVCNLNCVAAP